MGSMEIYFHATTDELARYVEQWMTDDGVYAAAIEYFPFVAVPLGLGDIRTTVMRPKVERFVFTEQPPNCAASGNLDFLDKNPSALVLDIGRLGPRGLEECYLSTINATPKWRQIASFLKRRTKAGAMEVSELTGASGFSRIRRYTPDAEALAKAGVVMRVDAQSPFIIRFGKPEA